MLIYAYLCLNFWSGNRFSKFSASKFPWSDWWFSAPRSSAIWRWSHTLKGNFEDFELFFTGIGTMHPIVVGNCKHRPSQTMYWLGMVDEWPVQSQCKVNAKSMQSQCKQSNAFAATIECNQMHFPKTIFSKKIYSKKTNESNDINWCQANVKVTFVVVPNGYHWRSCRETLQVRIKTSEHVSPSLPRPWCFLST